MAASMRRDSPWLALVLLTAISTVGFVDRIVMNVLAVPIRPSSRSATPQVGLLTGLAFSVLNATLGILVARYADRGNRLSLIAVGTLLWSIATAACGRGDNFAQMLLARSASGVGEAGRACPAAQSVPGDYFPPERRRRR
jgi:MFS family permease